ncbi:glycosyltransferase family 2 protein [Acinetobacter towneri]|uniref:glycosyltransferase family 2 protein n=1 Tax=Acinetobacter towneri TaxID=202956 RepID=UPI00336C1479
MSNDPKVSIIIPVYGVEKYIVKCIESIKSQSFKDFEAILINDGTKDNSIEVAEKAIAGDDRFIILNKENGGQGSARNLGLDYVRSPYIAFLDSDDSIEPDYLELMYEKICKENADVCVCDILFVDEENNIVDILRNDVDSHNKHDDFLLGKKFITNFLWDKLWKKEVFDGYRFDEEMRTNEDVLLIFQLLYKKKIVSVQKPLYRYLQRVGSTSKAIHPTYFSDRVKIKNKQIEFARDNNLFISNEKYCDYVYLKTFVYFAAITFARYSTDYKTDIRKLYQEIDKNFFSVQKILDASKFDKKVSFSLLILKFSPFLFRIIVKFWFRNKAA